MARSPRVVLRERPDIVITDLVMPASTGRADEAIRQRHRRDHPDDFLR